ncbi:acyltransferase [Streptomyces marincola]|uniref:acyltransferase n=1 Tax=Streptomyces marincola TaxID=2878388 RepID=UPI001CF2EBE6|nr:acyltransferase [Streptomyces marincola]UCM87887.1 acyltransferase [Streptomyces marincola]
MDVHSDGRSGGTADKIPDSLPDDSPDHVPGGDSGDTTGDLAHDSTESGPGGSDNGVPTDDPKALDYNGWLFWQRADEEQRAAQRERQRALTEQCGAEIGPRTFLSPLAMISPTVLRIGADSYIAAHAYVTGTLNAGNDCTVNPFTVVRGTVTLGSGVRIGAHASILGFNHSMAPDRPVFRQPVTERGITIGDDVWIGSNAVVVDGVTIGSHAVVGAGAVVTRDVPEWAVVAGNPARFIRDRRTPKSAARSARAALADRLAAFAERAAAQADAVVARCWEPAATAPDGTATGRYVDAPGAPATLRAHADAVEITYLLAGRAPVQLPVADHVRRLRQNQDPRTGLTPPLDADGGHGPAPTGFEDGAAHYHVLSLGYALDLLGSRFEYPVAAVARMLPEELIAFVDGLPWQRSGWGAGAGVDTIGTALMWNLRRGREPAAGERAGVDAFFGRLLTHCHPDTGMWSRPRPADGLLQPVNGYYRATRGSFAQFGLPVPHPERAIDTVLRHAADARHFGPGRSTACNVLDVAHPLWLTGRQTSHRATEAEEWALGQIDGLIATWTDGQGFPFRVPPLSGPSHAEHRPGLQGTEMWLATLWYLADLAGLAESLGYRPRGVHRPEPAVDLAAL